MFEMSARDMARFGQLYLADGRWKGRQIVPAAWVEKSSHTSEMVNAGHMDQSATSICGGWNMVAYTWERLRFRVCTQPKALEATTFSSCRA